MRKLDKTPQLHSTTTRQIAIEKGGNSFNSVSSEIQSIKGTCIAETHNYGGRAQSLEVILGICAQIKMPTPKHLGNPLANISQFMCSLRTKQNEFGESINVPLRLCTFFTERNCQCIYSFKMLSQQKESELKLFLQNSLKFFKGSISKLSYLKTIIRFLVIVMQLAKILLKIYIIKQFFELWKHTSCILNNYIFHFYLFFSFWKYNIKALKYSKSNIQTCRF